MWRGNLLLGFSLCNQNSSDKVVLNTDPHLGIKGSEFDFLPHLGDSFTVVTGSLFCHGVSTLEDLVLISCLLGVVALPSFSI